MNLPCPQTEPGKLDFFDYSIEEAEELMGEIAGRAYHGRSVVSYVYKQNYTSFDEMFSLPKNIRQRLKDEVRLEPLKTLKRFESKDGTVKFLFEVDTPKGPQEIESVYIPDDERVTLCVSSQVGCKMACQFCLTAQLGFKSNLSSGDIVRQVFTVNHDPKLRRITNVVFMGMGEPFDNFAAVRKATQTLTHVRGLYMSARKITVSTVGLVEKIDEIEKTDPFKLAVSLNASHDELRSRLMPVNRRWNMSELFKACRSYSHRTNKKVTFEYILMSGLTDRDEDAKFLIQELHDMRCKINLIPYNESQFTEFRRPSDERVLAFHELLRQAGIAVFIRKNRGNDIYAACGMLRRVQPTEPKVG